jgi:hypothetical protein
MGGRPLRSRGVEAFETDLRTLFNQIDHELEEKWGGTYPLHPSRAPEGGTGNPESDGLFNIGASFSAGYGSDHGKGYVIDIRLVTLSHVDEETREEIRAYVSDRVRELLPEYFPDRSLDVVRDGDLFKITGDLRL